MAETLTPRLGLRQYSADTDTFHRTELNEITSALETKAAIYGQGTLATRPAAGTAGRYYTVVGDTAARNGLTYFDTGTEWVPTRNSIYTAPDSATPAAQLRNAGGQTANNTEWQNSAGTVQAFVTASGGLGVAVASASASFFGSAAALGNARVGITPASTAHRGLIVQGVAGQTQRLQEWWDSAGTRLASVDAAGQVYGQTASIVGAAAFGSATVSGTLGVTGATTLSSLAASGNATVGGTLGVTGATTLGTANVTTLNLTNALTQAKTHASPDTDTAAGALHHTLGTAANQAAAGNHGHVANVTRVFYTSGTGGARPAGATYVEWVGPSQPSNWIDGDTWVSTAA